MNRQQLLTLVIGIVMAAGARVLLGQDALSSAPKFSARLLLAQDALPKADPPFTGKVDIDARKSLPQWPPENRAPNGAPNIVLILVDDVGYSATSTFGGPISTPAFSRLAGVGLRYNQFSVNALCSPTRASLLSGRNDHQMGFGTVAELAAGYPGYNSVWPKTAACVAEVLKGNGYSTAAFGKWHNTPAWQVSPAGPFERWPIGLGFEYFYGFLTGSDSQYYPRIFRNTTPVEPPATPEQGYHFTVDIANEAIRWLHQHDAVAAEKPFFLYFATAAAHSPHQVPKEWVEKYRGQFDQGWDKLREETFERQKKLGIIPANAKLTARPPGLPAWDSLNPDERKLLAHEEEVYAGYVAQADHEIGRLLKAIQDEGKSTNTIVLWIFGDNGGSAQGGQTGIDAKDVRGAPRSLQDRLATEDELGSEVFMNHYAASWAWAESTPFQGTKADASHLGGTRDPLVVSWPARIKDAGGLRSQFSHVNDVVPTLYEVAGLNAPQVVNGVEQTPLEGRSIAYTFDHPNEPSHHHIQFFATNGNRAIYKDGWWAAKRRKFTWEPEGDVAASSTVPQDYDLHPWELYNLNDDFSQANNLADKYPEKLKELEELFDQEARRNQVYPLLPGAGPLPTPQARGKSIFTYRDGVDRLRNSVAPMLIGMPYTISADVMIPANGARGVILAQGGRYGGISLFVKDNRVVFEMNAFGNRAGQIVASDPLAAGEAHIVVKIVPDRTEKAEILELAIAKAQPGTGTLVVNDKPQGSARFDNLNGKSRETLDIGSDLGSPVSKDYQSPFRFTGNIEKVTIQLE